MQTITSVHLPLGLSASELHSFQVFSPALLVRWGQNTDSTAGGPVCLSPLASVWVGGDTPGYFQFPKWFLQLGWARSYPQPWYELIPLPVLSTQEPFMPSTAFAMGEISSACLPLSWSATGASRSCYQPLWSDGAGRHSSQWMEL